MLVLKDGYVCMLVLKDGYVWLLESEILAAESLIEKNRRLINELEDEIAEYKKGFDCAMDAEPRTANPHQPGSPLAIRWAEGWEAYVSLRMVRS